METTCLDLDVEMCKASDIQFWFAYKHHRYIALNKVILSR